MFIKMKFTQFPSPTGVNYYEWFVKDIIDTFDMKRFPSPTGVNYYEFSGLVEEKEND